MDPQFVQDRISRLLVRSNISEYKLSLDLGHSKSYIQSITSGRALPSFKEFLNMCDYLNITPKDFFDEELDNPQLVNELYQKIKKLEEDDLKAVLAVVDRLKAKCE